MHPPSSILILYDPVWTHIPTVREFLQGLQQFSSHRLYFSPAYIAGDAPTALQLERFDAVVLHYSVRLTVQWPRTGLRERLRSFTGLKAAFLQDEYEDTEIARRSLEELGISLVFTCVPEAEREKFYSAARFPNTSFVQILTGYVPLDLDRRQRLALPLGARTVEIGYRGRRLGYWYGTLAMEKWWLGRDAKAWCEARGVRCDIAWGEGDRLYGDEWFAFLGRCVAALGCESGANLIDEHGEVRRAVEAYVQHHPDAGFEEVHAACLRPFDERTQMNQLSPRVFEAVAMRTALVLYPGRYSGVLEPYVHYFPMEKDGSNFDAVVTFIRDPAAVEIMTERAYDDLIRSGRYGYEALARQFDNAVTPLLRSARSVEVWPPAAITSVAADGSPERLVLDPGEQEPAAVVQALRAGAPSQALLAYNSEFIVPASAIRRMQVRRFQEPAPGVYEGRMRAKFVVACELDGAVAELHLQAGTKETAVVHGAEGRVDLPRPALADRLRLVGASQATKPSTIRLSVRGIRQTQKMIVPEPWPTRTLKAAWRLLPLEWRLSAPAMRAKAVARALAQARRPRQV